MTEGGGTRSSWGHANAPGERYLIPLLCLFVACAATLALSILFVIEDRPPYLIDEAYYSALVFVASGLFMRYSLARIPEEGFIGRTVLAGVGGGVVTLVALVLGYYARRGTTAGTELILSLVGAAIGGVVVGAFGGILMSPVVAFAMEKHLFDRFDRLLFSLSMVTAILATIMALNQTSKGSYGGYDGAAIMIVAAAGLVATVVRDRRRRAWFARLPDGWSVEPIRKVEEGLHAGIDLHPVDEALPSFVVNGEDVLVKTETGGGGGPFRGAVTAERIARFDRQRLPRILASRTATAIGAMLLMAALVPRLVLQRRAVMAHENRRPDRHPRVVDGIGETTQIVVANDYACAISDRKLWCWGNEAGTRLGLRDAAQWKPVPAPLSNVDHAFASRSDLCATVAPDGMRCSNAPPMQTVVPRGTVEMAFASDYSLARTADGRVFWWGDRTHLLPPEAPVEETKGPLAEVEGLHDIRQISAGNDHACAVDAAGDVFCWGTDYAGSVSGLDEAPYPPPVRPPTKVAGVSKIERVVVGIGSTWARGSGGRWYSWGDRARRAELLDTEWWGLGLSEGTEHVRDLVLTPSYACALFDNGAVKCAARQWAEQSSRHLMDSLPPGSALELAGSEQQVCARSDHDVRCWGPYQQ